ncbi:MAG: ribonuclease HII [Candidatus Syntrophonatronum acetioxidans]|uniref:Ribonuclease HII n=1 Tax=Candidatus Syntrophonatronum acetioxidans TaxID=1795816 RepID=A0A424YCS8_9FIRM|nr:MAG: ribonuclease HII [Candidatus Syntrophonatronum acetioxidans]
MIDSSKMTVKEVSLWLEKNEYDEKLLKDILKNEKRKSLHNLIEARIKKIKKNDQELIRVEEMASYEKALWSKGYKYIAGVDEAGRGPLAGPVVAAAVILPPYKYVQGIKDSKKLTASVRSKLFEHIKKEAVSFSTGTVEASYIDNHNIYQAGIEAMERAIKGLDVEADYLLVDAFKIPGISLPQNPIIKGDSLSMSIACASVLAKVTRDRIMEEYDRAYPQYGFGHHKGYATREHMEALRLHGPSPLHRHSFNWDGRNTKTGD